jgi:hypothetical protein
MGVAKVMDRTWLAKVDGDGAKGDGAMGYDDDDDGDG